ncbi:MAG: UDP-N-acetylmuramoyl-tripeptide--D-alanyl-D-alanine ligase [Acidobacteriota bacterium]
MPRLSLGSVAEMVGGEVLAGADLICDSVVIDSREAKEGSLFIAIRGERLDGHSFIDHSLQKATGIMVDTPPDPLPPGKGIVRVADTTVALQALAREIRRSFPFTLVAVTGSAGKTTTKEMIAALMASERTTWKSWGNFNNQIGCPLCIANTPDGTEVVVSEMGMNHAGELEMMSRLLVPDVSVYTNVGPVHLEFFESIDGIAAAKRELLEHMRQDGTVVVNADDPRVLQISEEFPGRRISYGVENDADYQALEVEVRGLLGSRFSLLAEGGQREFTLSMPGLHNLENAVAAIATARALGITWDGIAYGLATILPAKHRGILQRWRGAMLYDDTYNSNPAALMKTLRLLDEAAWDGRKVAVIGDMLELGAAEEEFHREIGQSMPRSIESVIAVGSRSRAILDGARQAGYSEAVLHHFDTADDAGRFLKSYIRDNDLVLLKASRGIGLDKVITILESEA